ncbi:MAG: UvrD-helicase domain-containing protein [Anaerolineaceae bacterium]|nr:UvrD-helicase domain-containing protein [Anaerolineaceae bacterium]
MDYLADLTPAQTEAVTHVDGPLLVLAGAGSGKTRVITRRVAYLLSQGIADHQVLAITFTNKAAEEMRSRIARLVPIRRMTAATFHSFCARTLRIWGHLLGLEPSFTIYSQADSKRTVKEAIQRLDMDPTHWSPDRIQGRISHLKNRLQGPEEFAQEADDYSGRNVAKIYEAYQAALGAAKAMDFDDLLMKVAIGLRDNAEFREVMQDRYRYVLIDEYQDTNEAQYHIAHLVADKYKNICATGDPDQSIYGWRGANINNILDFEEDFPGCRVIRLEQNYRSTPQILEAAGSLIRHNRKRKAKELFTENPSGLPVQVVEVGSAEDESRHIADQIRSDCGPSGNYSEVAVFYRVNSLSRAIEDALRGADIPYEIVRGMSFYERQEIRALVAYLRVLVNPADDLAVQRIINTPARGIGDTTVKRLQVFARKRSLSLLEACRMAGEIDSLKARAKKLVTGFAELIDELAGLDRDRMEPLVTAIVKRTGYDDYCRKLGDGEQDRLANVGEFVTVAANFDAEAAELVLPEDEAAAYSPLMRFLERVSLTSDQDDVHEEVAKVHLMTLHAAKGLEFPAVYIVGMEQGLLPHAMAEEDGRDIEEERRLCFVGMTRAKKKLTLLFAQYRMQRGQTNRQGPSVFLEEIGESGVQRRLLDEPVAGYGAYHPSANKGWANGRTRRYPAGRQTAADRQRHADLEEDARLRAALPQDDSPYRKGLQVRHPTYGVGIITRLAGSGEGTNVYVRFPHVGEKAFKAAFARLAILG